MHRIGGGPRGGRGPGDEASPGAKSRNARSLARVQTANGWSGSRGSKAPGRGCRGAKALTRGSRGQGASRAGPGQQGSGAHPIRAGLASMDMVWVEGQERPLSRVQGQRGPCRCAEAAPLPCALLLSNV